MPYAEHPEFATPPDRTVVWRYLDLARFVSLLEKGIWLQRLDLLGDPREGELTEYEIRTLREQDEEHVDRIRALETSQRYNNFVSCWYEGGAESMAMWDLYGGESAVAVRSTIGNLKMR
jgi:hypothetical protein